jgi:tetratricopeptide (TPR) repeat protein
LRELKAAVAICPTGKSYYRLGQYYKSSAEWSAAIDAFERSRSLEPKMLQNLHALADAYLAADRPADAERTMQTVTALQLTPYGQVRAMHELVETEFAYAHAMLGDIALKRSDWDAAATQYEQAKAVLNEYWTGRNYLVNLQGRTQDKRKALADLYQTVMQQLQICYTHLGKTSDAAAASAKLNAIKADVAADAANPNVNGAASK